MNFRLADYCILKEAGMLTQTLVEETVTWLEDSLEQVIEETLHLCRIPAPTFDEAERAAYVAERMQAIGLADVRTDAIHNVSGVLSTGQQCPSTLVVAHIDTVFPRTIPLDTRRTAKRLYGPSIGDNSVAVAAMLQVATAMQRLPSSLPGRVIFAASVGEEGLGNLCGIRALLDAWEGQIDTVLAIEGHGIDEVRHAGIGSTRLEVTFEGQGGHSWGAFGTPSAIHALGSAIHKIAQIQVTQQPKTTYNVGLITGGESVNTIASRATMLVDLRSALPRSLRQLETRLARILREIERQSNIKITSRIVGQRPAAALDPGHTLCQSVQAIRTQLHLRPAVLTASSTDANLPLSIGIPALCLGITRGSLAHTVEEYIDIAPIPSGLKQLFLTILSTLQAQQ
jgi:acetylornithine deacetylase/succinyl-diaminopimelate desuccinylase-like protein